MEAYGGVRRRTEAYGGVRRRMEALYFMNYELFFNLIVFAQFYKQIA